MSWRPKPGGIHTPSGLPALGSQPEDHWPSADRPIMSADQDMLGRGRFARRVAEVINGARQREESSVLAIVGPWGSGKSSVINLARGAGGAEPFVEDLRCKPLGAAGRLLADRRTVRYDPVCRAQGQAWPQGS
jgi:hypothetical protein